MIRLLLLALCVEMGFAQNRGLLDPVFPVRAVHIFAESQDYAVSDDFLKRASLNGFNYVILECALDGTDWDRTTGKVRTTKTTGKTLRLKMKEAFQKVDRYGMRLIPEFQTADGHSRHWDVANASIAWNVIGPAGVYESYCTPYAPDAPMDLSFDELITTIRNGFKDAALPYPLEYIHIGMDEAVRNIGNPVVTTIMIGQCTPDRTYLNTFDATKNGFDRTELENGIRSLIALHIDRRTDRIRTICNATGYGYATKMMIYGDMLDPQHSGGQRYLTPVPGNLMVATDGALNKVAAVTRPNVVYSPWMYPSDDYPYYSGNDYDTYNTLSHFKAQGAKVAFAHEIGDDCIFSDGVGGGQMRRQNQFKEWLFNSQLPEFRNTIVGYVAAPWCAWSSTSPSISFKTLEFLSNETTYLVPFNN
ncbi:MAG: hypothetical protein JWP91_1110 [Fibrobacteres bacterium]|nr:hypothetical protein [Fibrobacterota bacterium]